MKLKISFEEIKGIAAKAAPTLFIALASIHLLEVYQLHWFDTLSHSNSLCFLIGLFLLSTGLSLDMKTAQIASQQNVKITRHRKVLLCFSCLVLASIAFFAILSFKSHDITPMSMVMPLLPAWAMCYWLNCSREYLIGKRQLEDTENGL